jgi:hypothetical protein
MSDTIPLTHLPGVLRRMTGERATYQRCCDQCSNISFARSAASRQILGQFKFGVVARAVAHSHFPI